MSKQRTEHRGAVRRPARPGRPQSFRGVPAAALARAAIVPAAFVRAGFLRAGFVRAAIAAALFAAIPASGARAADIEGVQFPDSIELDGRPLVLNGTGLREVYIIKAWVAALYANEPAHSASALIGGTGERRIAITLLADMSIERLARSVLDALRRNHDPAQLAAIEPQIQAFVVALKSIGPSVKGDTLTLDMLRGTTRVGFNQMTVGEPIAGQGFRDALLRAFVGDEPVDDSLRRGLLGLPAPIPGPGV